MCSLNQSILSIIIRGNDSTEARLDNTSAVLTSDRLVDSAISISNN